MQKLIEDNIKKGKSAHNRIVYVRRLKRLGSGLIHPGNDCHNTQISPKKLHWACVVYYICIIYLIY
jgi:hypothetical protein